MSTEARSVKLIEQLLVAPTAAASLSTEPLLLVQQELPSADAHAAMTQELAQKDAQRQEEVSA